MSAAWAAPARQTAAARDSRNRNRMGRNLEIRESRYQVKEFLSGKERIVLSNDMNAAHYAALLYAYAGPRGPGCPPCTAAPRACRASGLRDRKSTRLNSSHVNI